LVTGKLPFVGPRWDDFRDQHLHAAVPELDSVQASLGALIGECLIKAPGARPRPANLMLRLEKITDTKPNSGLSKLQSVNLREVTKRMQSEAAESKVGSEAAVRKDLAEAASKSIADISNSVFTTISESASASEKSKGRNSSWNIALRNASLRFDEIEITSRDPWGAFKPPFTVIAHSAIGVVMPTNRYGYQGRDHSLWYCDAQKAGQFQWFEVAFMGNPMMRQQTSKSPCAISPDELTGKAFWPAIMEVQPAWPFTVLQLHDLEDFVTRWATWFAAAAEGTLTFPSHMPEREPSGSWRRS
jgi:eukaryotic-like serine/threonine-protein kinase